MLKNCLASLYDTVNPKQVKIIVVDNASVDGSAEMVESTYPLVDLIDSGGNIGFGRANNLAASQSDTPYVLFLNPDTIVLKDSIAKMVAYMESNPAVGALGGKMKFPNGTVQPLGLQWFPSPFTELLSMLFISQKTQKRLRSYLPYIDPNENSDVSKLYGGCLIVRKTVLDQVGWFDERFFMYGEDVDLCRRITDAGWKLYYLSDAEIIHLVAGASGNSTNQFSTLMKCESISKLMGKYYGKAGTLSYRIVIAIGSQVRLILLCALKALAFLRIVPAHKITFESSFRKYVAMIKWSFGLERPVIRN